MNPSDLAKTFTDRYLAVLASQMPKQRRTYGFEFEFLPDRPMDAGDLEKVENLLGRWGRICRDGIYFDNGLCVAFEPGGQIEYCSPPMLPEQEALFDELGAFMYDINARIKDRLGITYLAQGYLPGRKDAPLCLTTPRYVNLHRRLAKSGTRGHEMMKATAAIHLHAAICSQQELLSLFNRFCELAQDPFFQMSPVRRDIWDRTDPTRCGMPPCCRESLGSAAELIGRLVQFGMQAVVLGEEVPFLRASDRSFEAFLYHMTTIFTDVRFNLKGTTLELRTLDSMPLEAFKTRWERFVEVTADPEPRL